MQANSSHARNPSSARPPLRMALLTIAMSALLVNSGCAIQPKPFTDGELTTINNLDREEARRGMPEISGPLSLEEAIARALKFNLDHRTRMLEQSLAAGQLKAGQFDMLPKLMANAGYSWRDEYATRRATDSVTGLPSLANPYISSEREHTTDDIGLTWSLLDFGASYYTAKQNADRVLIASERRRKAMHTLIQNVRTAYWRALGAQALSGQIRSTLRQAEVALADSRRVSNDGVKSPGESLRFQRNLLENMRLLEGVERELSSARIELASLIGAYPGSVFKLVEPTHGQPQSLGMSAEQMEEIALTNNADLRESFYNVRIAASDTRKALLNLLPGITLNYSYNHDDDSYLVHKNWEEAGLKVGFNLFNLLAAPSRMKAAEMGKEVAEARRMALQMTVVTQIHLARHQYDDSLRQYQRANAIYHVDSKLAALARSQQESQQLGQLDRISTNVTAILSSVRRYQTMAKVHEAASRLQATMGLQPQIGSLDETDLATLQQEIGRSMNRLGAQQAPAQAQPQQPAQVAKQAEGTTSVSAVRG